MRRLTFVLLVALTTAGVAQQPKQKFQPQVTVGFTDGTTVELTEFALYAEHHSFGGGFYSPCSGRTDVPGDLLFRQGHVLKTVPTSSVKKLQMEKPDGDWMTAVLVLDSGQELKGMVPHSPTVTWISGDDSDPLEFQGERTVLGTKGMFYIDVEAVRSVEKIASAPSARFRITDADGKAVDVGRLLVGQHYSCPMGRRDDYSLAGGGALPVAVDRTEVSLPLKDIGSIRLLPAGKPGAQITMKKGDQATADLSKLECGYGVVSSGQKWFFDLWDGDRPLVASVRFR